MDLNINGKGVVLVIEDNEHIMKSTKGSLELEGHTVHTAGTLAEARTILADLEPDVILLDVDLPDGNGYDFCSEIHQQTQAYICIVTAHCRDEDNMRWLMNGAHDYLQKPYQFEHLFQRVEDAVHRRRTPQETE